MTDVFKGEHATIGKAGGVTEFYTNDHGPFQSNLSSGGVPVRRQLKHANDKLRIERINDRLYIEMSMSRTFEKSHDHIMGRMILSVEQIDLLKRIIDGTSR